MEIKGKKRVKFKDQTRFNTEVSKRKKREVSKGKEEIRKIREWGQNVKRIKGKNIGKWGKIGENGKKGDEKTNFVEKGIVKKGIKKIYR